MTLPLEIDSYIKLLNKELNIDIKTLIDLYLNLKNSNNNNIKPKIFNNPKMSSNSKCIYVINKGKDNERVCGVKTESEYCKKHTKTSDPEIKDKVVTETKNDVIDMKNISLSSTSSLKEGYCNKILKTNKQCGNKASVNGFCKKHLENEDQTKNNEEKKSNDMEKKDKNTEAIDKNKGKKTSKRTVDEPKTRGSESSVKETIRSINANNQQKDTELINKLVSKRIGSEKTKIQLKRNTFNNYEHVDTGLVFNTNNQVIGRQNNDGNLIELTIDDINLCKEYNLDYILPDKLKNTTSKTNNSLHDSDHEDCNCDEEEDDENEEENGEEDYEEDD
jgi:hypothetical protein